MAERGITGARDRARRTLAAGLVLAAGFAAGAGAAHAQVTVDRMEVEFPAGGEARTEVVEVINETTERIQADVLMEDWVRGEYGRNVWHPLGSQSQSCGERLRVFPEALLIEPGSRAELQVTMEPAEGEAVEECWSAAVISTSRVGKDGNLYVLRTAVKVYGLPAQGVKAGEVADLRVVTREQIMGEQAEYLGHGEQDMDLASIPALDASMLEVIFDNTGDLHLIGDGRVEFRRPDGTIATTVEVPTMYVLPGARRRAAVDMPELEPGQYAVLAIVDYGGSELTAMQMNYDVEAP